MSQGQPLSRPVNQAILSQHLEEAAFYWVRRQAGVWSPAFDKSEIGRIDGLLDAHLEGLRIAGVAAVEPAIRNLNRWKTADEAFVSTYVLTHFPDKDNLRILETYVHDMPQLINGAAAAMFWVGPGNSNQMLQRWWKSGYAPLMRAAIPALIANSNEKEKIARVAVAHEDPNVRSRALRAIGEWGLEDCLSLVKSSLEDRSAECRFEAATTHYVLGHKQHAMIAGNAMQEMNQQTVADNPQSKQVAQTTRRRALLYWATMSLDQDFQKWLNPALEDPDKCRDAIWALAFRGESSALKHFEGFLREDKEATLAAYALCHVTGLDLDKAGLFKVDGPDEEDADETETPTISTETDPATNASPAAYDASEDDGLLEPNIEKVLDWLDNLKQKSQFTPGQRYLGGLPIDQTASTYFVEGTQPQRWQSALHLSRFSKETGPMTEVARAVLCASG
ncbi:MAG: hypothetical protein AB8B55_08460 [Mariniblastus sp.]